MVVAGKFTDFSLDPKRGANRCAGFFALIFCAPLLIAITLAIRLGSAGPAIMIETRQMNGSGAYKMLRFRTVEIGERRGFGAFLRYSRLDHLPQLVNVMRGDISIASVLD